eukprot:m.1649070 g.1649070  ORF g.1649070 m.1649070 type:complete len:74 (-) comp81711_c0_seq1:46-267(-)
MCIIMKIYTGELQFAALMYLPSRFFVFLHLHLLLVLLACFEILVAQNSPCTRVQPLFHDMLCATLLTLGFVHG